MELIKWPQPDYEPGGWTDSGEGGLFCYAVWPLPKTQCVVDTEPSLGLGDVLVRANGPLSGEFASHFRTPANLGTVLFIGSTSASLYNDYFGEYFSVKLEDLDDEGAKLMKQLSELYGFEPTFVTYLDT